MTARRLALTAGKPIRALDETEKWGCFSHAFGERKRQERKAIRGPQKEGDVQAARGEDRQLAGSPEPRRQEVGLVEQQLAEQLQAGGHDATEEGSGSQGRQGGGEAMSLATDQSRDGRPAQQERTSTLTGGDG